MNKFAVVFPGQGSQYVQMGFDFYTQFPEAKQVFDQADEILGYSLSSIIFNGSEETLRITKYTQPALFVTSLAVWSVFKELGITPSFMAGHSLGEYSALAAAESISFADGLMMVSKRGQFMEDAVPSGQGTMAAVMGMEIEPLTAICHQITEAGNVVELANINTPNQIVISGTTSGVEQAIEIAKNNGARRVIPLSVSGPFHSRLMQPAKEKLQPIVNNSTIYEAKIPVVMNVTGRGEIDPIKIRSNLIDQVVSPVLWTNSVEWMIANGVDTFVELGPGKVLSGLVKKIDKAKAAYSIENVASWDDFLAKEMNHQKGEIHVDV